MRESCFEMFHSPRWLSENLEKCSAPTYSPKAAEFEAAAPLFPGAHETLSQSSLEPVEKEMAHASCAHFRQKTRSQHRPNVPQSTKSSHSPPSSKMLEILHLTHFLEGTAFTWRGNEALRSVSGLSVHRCGNLPEESCFPGEVFWVKNILTRSFSTFSGSTHGHFSGTQNQITEQHFWSFENRFISSLMLPSKALLPHV